MAKKTKNIDASELKLVTDLNDLKIGDEMWIKNDYTGDYDRQVVRNRVEKESVAEYKRDYLKHYIRALFNKQLIYKKWKK